MPANQTVFNEILARIQANDPSLTGIDMPSAGITDVDCALLANALQNNTVILSILLGDNPIGVVGITALAESLQINRVLDTLSFYGNNIGDAGVQVLSQSLQDKNITLRFLAIEGNGVGDNGAIFLAQLLQVSNSLQFLDLYGNSIGNFGTIALAQALEANTLLQSLDLGSNPSIGNPGAIALARALQINTGLKVLALYGNLVDDEGAEAFANILLKNKYLTILAFGLYYAPGYVTRITDIGAQSLIQSLAKNYLITRLDLTGNNVTVNNMNQISVLVARNQQCAGQLPPVLECPIVTTNSLTIHRGEIKVLTSDNLLLTNVSRTKPLNGNFTVSNVAHGQFLNAQNQSIITQFSQIDINNNQILFRHDNGTNPPSYTVTGQFGNLTTWPESAAVTFLPFFLPTIIPTTTLSPQRIAFNTALIQIKNNQVTYIDLSNHDITDADCIFLADALNSTTSLNTLYLGSNPFSNAGVIALANTLTTNRSLQSVDFWNCINIGPAGITALAQALQINTSLKSLGLQVYSGSAIDDSAAAALGMALRVNNVLETLDIELTGISNRGVISLAEGLQANPHSALKNLDLRFGQIVDSGAIALARMLEINTALLDLSLGQNQIGFNGAFAIAQALTTNKILQFLDLNDNLLSDAGAILIAQSLVNNPALQALWIGNNQIGNNGAQAFAELLSTNTPLRELSFSGYYEGNSIDFLGAQMLAQALTKNHILKTLTFNRQGVSAKDNGNPIGDVGSLALLQTLEKNYVITSLPLVNNTYAPQIEALTVRNNACQTHALFCPVIWVNQFIIQNGTPLNLSIQNLKLTESTGISLINGIFNISEIQHGNFKKAQQEITEFSQLDILQQTVSFESDSRGIPSFNITARYGNLTTFKQAAQIILNNPPLLMHPLMDQTVSVNESFAISIPLNTFSDPENQSLTFEVECDDQTLPPWLNFTDQTFRGRAPNVSNHRLSIFARDPLNATASTTFNLAVIAPKETATIDSSTSSALLSAGVLIAIITGVSTLVILFIVGIFLYRRSHTNKIQMDPTLEEPQILPLQNNPVYGQENNTRTVAGAQISETSDSEGNWDGRTYETGGTQDRPWDRNTYVASIANNSIVDTTPKSSNNFSIPWDAGVYSTEERSSDEDPNRIALRV